MTVWYSLYRNSLVKHYIGFVFCNAHMYACTAVIEQLGCYSQRVVTLHAWLQTSQFEDQNSGCTLVNYNYRISNFSDSLMVAGKFFNRKVF